MNAKLVKAYPYEHAMVYSYDGVDSGDIGWVRSHTMPCKWLIALETELVKQAGWHGRDNKTVFIFDVDGQFHTPNMRYAVLFKDGYARMVSWNKSEGEDYRPKNVEVRRK